jgi:zinc transporter, ZIP family
MASAFGWGLVAASSLVLGGLVGVRVRLSDRMLGLVMAFGAGVLISAVAYDLIEEAFDTASGFGGVGLGFAAGALAFYAGDAYVDRMGGRRTQALRRRSGGRLGAGDRARDRP